MLRLLLTAAILAAFSSVSFAQEANDDCDGAVEILLDELVAYSTVDATSAGPVVTGCGNFTPPENDSIPADIWFTWMAVESGTYSWSNCGSGWDSRMAVYLGADACAITNDDLVNCNDDGPAANCPDAGSNVVFTASAGNTYVLRLGGFANEDIATTSGAGSVRLRRLNVPANDACANAIAITTGAAQPYTTASATTDGPNHEATNPCFQFGSLTVAQDVWYTFTPDFSGTAQWVNCDAINYDSRMAVYQPGSACPPLPTDLYGCNDDGVNCSAGTFHSEMFFEVTAGETYLLRLGGYGTEQGLGTFDLLNNAPPAPPANDDCANAIETRIITVAEADDADFAEVGTTIGATFSQENFMEPSCSPFNPGGLWADVWYTVQTQGNESLEMRLFPDGSDPALNFMIDAFATCTDTLGNGTAGTCLWIDDEDSPENRTTITGLPAGENITIYIRVVTRLTTESPGSFGLQLVGDISTATREVLALTDLRLFPNPATDQVTISMVLPGATRLEAQVFDLLGRNVLTHNLGTLAAGAQRFDLDTRAFASGLYSVRLTDGRASQTMKFIIE
jgi:hypothetical protein